jgi:uncharacterized membrane-anchored protein YjiN (DUF445 family)
MRRRLADALITAGQRLGSDRRLQEGTERIVELGARALVVEFHDELTGLVTRITKRRNVVEIPNQPELLLRSGLRYIRINGTLVGAGVGLVLHLIALILA